MAYKITEAEYNKLSAEEQEKYTKRGKIRTKLKKFLTNEEKEKVNNNTWIVEDFPLLLIPVNNVKFKSDIRESKEEESINCEMNYSNNIDELFLQNNFTYLSADRIVPQSSYKYSKENVLRGNLGKSGEYTIHYLAENKNTPITLKELQYPDANSNQLLENVEYWLSKISKGIKVIPEVNINFLSRFMFGVWAVREYGSCFIN